MGTRTEPREISPEELEADQARRFKDWRYTKPGRIVRLLAVPGQQQLDLGDALDAQRRLETWGTESRTMGAPFMLDGRRVIELDGHDAPVSFDRVLAYDECPRCLDPIFYFPSAPNNDGWRCIGCEHRPGEPAGFDPFIDKHCIESKVSSMLMDLHSNKWVYMSNNDCGDAMTGAVVNRCRETSSYDQASILKFLFEINAEGSDGGESYWAKMGRAIVEGKDPRKRCPGGRLATVYSNLSGGDWKRSCHEKDCPVCPKDTSTF